MKEKLTLVILAAGMGSRFGGLKQIEPIGPNGEFIIDYSIYDAIKAGFEKVVFIIKRENYDIFRETIGKRIENFVEVAYAFQDNNDIPVKLDLSERVKPLGTAHAIYSARKEITGPFAIINSDDFYGRDAFNVLEKFYKEKSTDNSKEHFCLVGYKVSNTMPPKGSVKRGVCEVENNLLTKLTESKIEKIDGSIIAEPLSGAEPFIINKDCPVSMNMIGFTPEIIDYITEGFEEFFKENKDNLDKCEYLIPDVIFKSIKENKCDVKVLETTAVWYGVTYKEDKESVVTAINNMIKDNIYKENLWEK